MSARANASVSSGSIARAPCARRFARQTPACQALESVDGGVELVERHELAIGVGHENRTRAEKKRRAPAVEKRHVGRKREHAGLEAADGVHADRPHPEELRDRHPGLETLEDRKDVVGRTDRPEHDLGGRVRGDDVWRHPAFDQANGVEGRAEIGIDRKRQAAQLDERIDEFLDRRLALLRDR